MLKWFLVIFVGAVLCTGSPSLAVAQEEVDAEFVSGNVTSLSAESLTVEVYDGEEATEKVFVVNERTTLENMKTIDELNAGDAVFIDFFEEDGKIIALNIYRSDDNSDEESWGESDEELSGDPNYEQEEKE